MSAVVHAAPDGASIGRVAVDRPAGIVTTISENEVVLLAADFEDSWPASPWRVEHVQTAADVDWGRTALRASAGSHSIWCAGSGAAAPAAGDPVPPGTTSWAIAGPIDLGEATTAHLQFDLWLQTEASHDLFMWLVSTDGEHFNGLASSRSANGWQTVTTDLSDWGDAGSVLGASRVWIAFVYASDHSNAFEGAYVDAVRLTADYGSPVPEGIVYSTEEDFGQGELVGLDASGDALALEAGWSSLPFIWIPNTEEGTVSRLSTASGLEVARYRTGPDRDLVPSGIAVDLDGSCWVGNFAAGTVVKIGLEDRGDCVDRDLDGAITTSRDSDDDGQITGSELLAWGADECVLYEVTLIGGVAQSRVPGTVHEDYENNGVSSVAIDADNDVWVGVAEDQLIYHRDSTTGEWIETVSLPDDEIHPNDSLFGADGALWTTSWPRQQILIFDPATSSADFFDVGHPAYAVGRDAAGEIFVAAGSGGVLSRVDPTTGEVVWTNTVAVDSADVCSTEDGALWVADPNVQQVRRVTPDGVPIANTSLNGQPTALTVDASGKIWAMGASSRIIERINPLTNSQDLQRVLSGDAGHDALGDLTGVVSRSVTTRVGSWRVGYDSGLADAAWGTVTWSGSEPEGTSTTVRVRSSDDEVVWSSWENAVNARALSATPVGRYLMVEAVLHGTDGGNEPTIEELSIMPRAAVDPPGAAFTWQPTSPSAGEPVSFVDTSIGTPTAWAWSFGDGGDSTEADPSHTYGVAGTYTVGLTVTNEGGSDSATADIVVRDPSQCILSCSAEVPMVGFDGESVSFQGVVTATGCTELVSSTWDLGDGPAVEGLVADHTFGEAGTFAWTFTATSDGVECSRDGTLEISNDTTTCSRSWWIPVASHADGVAGSVWRTELGVLGDAVDSDVAEVRLHAGDGLTSRRISVPAGRMVEVSDVVAWLRPGNALSAALEVCSDGPLIVTSRTANTLASDDPCHPDGTFGQRLDGWEPTAGLATGDVVALPQLRQSATFRTNLGFTNTGDGPASLEVTLMDAQGAALTSYPVEIGSGQWYQDNRPFELRAGIADLGVGWARIEVTDGAGVLVYASVIDSRTNDATTVSSHALEPLLSTQ
jgi:PKD repeat protein